MNWLLNGSATDQLEADLRHALQEFIPVEPDSLHLSGIR
jgi:hypothetical protein